jgi:hypothetical protein
MSVYYYVGRGRHGHLGIIMMREEYFAIAADVFPVPNNPGASPEVVVGMKAAVIADLTRLHREAAQVYRTYHSVDDNAYLNALSDEVVGYANCTSLDILTHLLTFYAMIASTELTQNYERLNTPYDTNQPIETLFQQIQDARAFTVAGGQPYCAAMIINVAYTLVFNTGLFPDACRAWQSSVKLLPLPLPQPPVRARTDARTNPSAQRATQLRSVLARVYAVSIQNPN